MNGFFVLLAIIGILFGVYTYLTRPRKDAYFATAEYWVFLPGLEMPEQNEMMDRVIGKNPYRPQNRDPIGTKEGLVFSDVRLHIALVLRSKNSVAFRPDLFTPLAGPTAEDLRALSDAQSFVKLRFTSEERLKDRRHLQFLAHAADAVAELGDSKLIYDPVCERLMPRTKMQEILGAKADVSGPDVQNRVLWRTNPESSHAETRGMVKIGLPELITPESPTDQRVLIDSILDETIRNLWEAAEIPDTMQVSAFDDTFEVLFEPQRKGPVQVRILRVPQATND